MAALLRGKMKISDQALFSDPLKACVMFARETTCKARLGVYCRGVVKERRKKKHPPPHILVCGAVKLVTHTNSEVLCDPPLARPNFEKEHRVLFCRLV